jgi:hypothetical protein
LKKFATWKAFIESEKADGVVEDGIRDWLARRQTSYCSRAGKGGREESADILGNGVTRLRLI